MFCFRNAKKKINPKFSPKFSGFWARIFGAKGFTLVEIILVACLTAIIGGTVYAAFSQGVRLSRYAMNAKPLIDLDILYDKMTLDLHNVIADPPGSFSGNEEVFQFMTLSSAPPKDPKNKFGTNKRPLLAGYYYDVHEKVLIKMFKEYTDVLNADPRKKLDGKVIFQHVKSCKFGYYGGRNQRGERIWRKLWKEKCLPKGLRIAIELDDLKKVQKIDQIISIQGETCPGENLGPG